MPPPTLLKPDSVPPKFRPNLPVKLPRKVETKDKEKTKDKDKLKEDNNPEVSASTKVRRALISKLNITTNRTKTMMINTLTRNAINLKAADLNTKTKLPELKVSQKVLDTDLNLQHTTMDNRRKSN